jgi:hypothetical protein
MLSAPTVRYLESSNSGYPGCKMGILASRPEASFAHEETFVPPLYWYCAAEPEKAAVIEAARRNARAAFLLARGHTT